MNRIKCIRAYFKMSQSEFAKRFHVDQTAVSNWEKEKNNIDIKIMQLISEEFKIPIEFILGKQFVLRVPLEEWSEEQKKDYENVSAAAKDFVLYRYGKGFFPEFHSDEEALVSISLEENKLIYNRNGKNIIKRFSKDQIKLVHAFIDNLSEDNEDK